MGGDGPPTSPRPHLTGKSQRRQDYTEGEAAYSVTRGLRAFSLLLQA
jgi:hypothetical protein